MPATSKYFKKTNIFRTCTAALLMSAAAPFCYSAQSAWTSNDNAAHNVVWESRLMHEIGFLSDSLCSGRATGTAGGNEAAFYIMRRFSQEGLLCFSDTYAKHVFAGGGLVGHNIIGMLPGSKKDPCRSYIIVGAHYDHLGIINGKLYPGADSNASGTVAMLTLADMFSAMKLLGKTYRSNIIFAAFDAYGMNLAGSQALWRMIEAGELTDPLTGEAVTPDKIRLMVNLDQIGSSLSPLSSGRKDYLIMLGNKSLPKDRQALPALCNTFYETGLEIAHTYYGSEDFTRIFYTLSDQRPFVENGIPSVLFTSGITMNNNKTIDRPGTLDMEVLRKRIIFIFHWLEKVM